MIRPEKLELIEEALHSMSIQRINVSPVMDYGNQLGWKDVVHRC